VVLEGEGFGRVGVSVLAGDIRSVWRRGEDGCVCVFGKGWRSLPWAIGGGVGDCGQEGMYCDDHMRVDQAGVR
jgi:hypothetical protein